jgi:hypothetical protein
MKREGLLAVIAGLLLAAGLLVGYVPVHSSSGQDCGSPFDSNVNVLRLSSSYAKLGSIANGSYGDLGFGDAAAECDSKHNSTRPIAILLIALGAAGLLAAFAGYTIATRKDLPTPAQPIDS